MRARTRRLYTFGIAAVLLLAAAGLAFMALRQNANLFYTPHTLAEKGLPKEGREVKVGGWVEPGSLTYSTDGATMMFTVIDSSDADIKSFEISLQFFELYNEQLQARARAPAHTQWRVRGRQPARCMGLQPASHHASHVHMHLCGEQAQHHMHTSRPSTGTRRHTAHAAHACSPLAPAGRPRPRLGRQIQAHARPTPSRPALPRRTCSMSARQWM